MTVSTTSQEPPGSHNTDRPGKSDAPISAATRYLCAAAHLRRSMLPEEIVDPDTSLPRPPQPVGRLYARRVLFERQGLVPMPGVNQEELRRHCYAAFRQTLIRDGAALAALGIAAFMAPGGTAVTLGLIAAVVMLTGRVRISSPLVLGAATGVAIALIYSQAAGTIRLLPPLIAIGACFLIYTADNLWARQRVRRLLREPARAPADIAGHEEQEGSGVPEPFRPSFNDKSQSKFHSKSQTSVSMPTLKPIKVFYEKDRIVGTGTPLATWALTVAVDKPAPGKPAIIPFRAPDLISYILAHLRAQGAVEQGTSAFAYRKVFWDDKWHPLDMPQPSANGRASGDGQHFSDFESFTHGLPDLDVREVIAVPVPRVKLVPAWWFLVRYVIPQLLGRRAADQTQLSDLEYRSFVQRPPTAHPERHYVRASATTWDGQVVISIYTSVVLQGHYLRVLARPYVLAPVVPELKHAGELALKNIAVQAGGAIYGTMRQVLLMAEWLNRKGRSRKDSKGVKGSNPASTKLSSTRESYALSYTDNLHHAEDADRMIEVMELKVIKVTREYLRDHNIDLEDYDRQVQVYINSTVVGDIKNVSGNVAIGSMIKQQGSPGGSGEGRNGSK